MCIFAAFVCMHIQSFDQFNEMAVQYGYLALFAPAFPLAPLLAFINNIFEIRIDAIKFCAIHQRPRFRQAEDIGTWYVLYGGLRASTHGLFCAGWWLQHDPLTCKPDM